MRQTDGRSRSPRSRAGGDSQEIMQLIVQREEARLRKDFNTADALRAKLASMGVTLFDKSNSWRAADGRSGTIPSFSAIEAGLTADSLGMQAEVMPTLDDRDPLEAHIRDRVKHREQARASKDFALSDQIRDELNREYGVELFDKEKMWRTKEGLAGCIIGYSSEGIMDTEITALVARREKARLASDWGTADLIRNELREHGVDIFDKDKVWKTSSGRSGPVPTFSALQGDAAPAPSAAPAFAAPAFAAPGPRAAPSRAAPRAPPAAAGLPAFGAAPAMAGNVSAFACGTYGANPQQELIQVAMQAMQDPALAERMLSALRSAGFLLASLHGAVPGAPPPPALASRPPAPRAGCAAGGAAGGAPGPPRARSKDAREALRLLGQCKSSEDMRDDQIEWAVALREKARQGKEFDTSDDLRAAMRVAGIELHEKEKRWSTRDGREGPIPSWDELG